MQTRSFGASGRRIPILGQGTWSMEHDRRADVLRAIRTGLDLGMTHIDTAEMYGDGLVERIVGEAIARRRDEVFLASKILPANASRAGTVQACERSLSRLATDRLDLYLLHWPGRHPLGETLLAFEDLRKAGKIIDYGVSNFDVAQLESALALAGDGRIACNQVYYQLEVRGIEHRLLPFCSAHRIALVAYSPFGAGRFPSPATDGGRELAAIANTRGATPRQVALRFLTRDANVFAIPKAGRADHIRELAAADAVELAAADIARLDAAFPRGAPPARLAFL